MQLKVFSIVLIDIVAFVTVKKLEETIVGNLCIAKLKVEFYLLHSVNSG